MGLSGLRTVNGSLEDGIRPWPVEGTIFCSIRVELESRGRENW